MSLHASVRKVIKRQKLIYTASEDHINLKDSGMKVRLTGISDPLCCVTAISIESLRHLHFLNDGIWKRVCDYLLILQRNHRYYAIFIELKRSMSAKEKAKEQLRRSLPILHYILSVCKIEDGFDSNISKSYVIIAEKNSPRLDKQRVKNPRNEHIEIHKAIKIKMLTRTTISVHELIRR